MSTAKAIGLFFLGFVLIAGLSIGIWAFKVATSDVKGHGDSVIQKNSATNRTGSQQQFEKLYQEAQVADQRVDVMAQALKASPDSEVAKTNYVGAQSYCLSVVGDYNALARTWTAQDFKAVDLPPSLDSTMCREDI